MIGCLFAFLGLASFCEQLRFNDLNFTDAKCASGNRRLPRWNAFAKLQMRNSNGCLQAYCQRRNDGSALNVDMRENSRSPQPASFTQVSKST
jgi:hypothetical protein